MTFPQSTTPQPEPKQLDLATWIPSARSRLWITAASIGVGLLTFLFIESYALAVVCGFAVRQSLPMILGTRGEARRAAILLNLCIVGFWVAAIAAAYNARTVLRLLGMI